MQYILQHLWNSRPSRSDQSKQMKFGRTPIVLGTLLMLSPLLGCGDGQPGAAGANLGKFEAETGKRVVDDGVSGEGASSQDVRQYLDKVTLNEQDYARLFLGIEEPIESRIDNVSEEDFKYIRDHATFSVKDRMSPVKTRGQCERGTCSVFAAVALLEFATPARYSEQCLAFMSSVEDSGRTEQRLKWAARPQATMWSHLFSLRGLSGLIYENECPYQCGDEGRNVIPAPILAKQFSPIRRPFMLYEQGLGGRSAYADPVSLIKGMLVSHRRPAATPIYFAEDKNELWSGQFRKNEESFKTISVPAFEEFRKGCEEDKKDRLKRVDSKRSVEFAEAKRKCDGHYIVISGYDDYSQAFEFKNSWGPRWGYGGYGRVGYDYIRQFYQSNSDVLVIE